MREENKHYTTDTTPCILMRFLARVPVSSSQKPQRKCKQQKKNYNTTYVIYCMKYQQSVDVLIIYYIHIIMFFFLQYTFLDGVGFGGGWMVKFCADDDFINILFI